MEQVLKEAAKIGGKVLLSHLGQDHQIKYKYSHQDYCTQADIESQDAVKQSIIGQCLKMGITKAEIGFIGEENLDEASHKHLFIIDPLDGTTNFESGLDYFAVSIAYCLNGEILEGVIYRPTNGDFYYAKKNSGSFKNDKRLSVGSKPLKECLMDGIISSRSNVYPKMFRILEKIFPNVKGLRSLFCMTLSNCFIAENILNLSINGNTYIWDIAAASLIVSEAGGIMFDFEGKTIVPNFKDAKQPYNVISCHPGIKDQVIDLINR
jgi:myo-inositol-1(or 4)-monophosphatase